MKLTTTLLALACFALAAGCDVQSGITKKSVEKYEPTPLPSVAPTPVPLPIEPADIVTVDTSMQGEIKSVNGPGKTEKVTCDKYNEVMVNNAENIVTIKGACSRITVNGERNTINAEAAMTIVFNGSDNKLTHTRYANGKHPVVTDNRGGNTVEKVAQAPVKK
jgi:hypothetical protein